MSVSTSVPDGDATGPAPRGSRVLPTVLTVLAYAVQAFVLFLTFVMGLGCRAWQKLTLEQQREVIDLLCNVRILRGTPGARSLDPETIEVTWKGA